MDWLKKNLQFNPLCFLYNIPLRSVQKRYIMLGVMLWDGWLLSNHAFLEKNLRNTSLTSYVYRNLVFNLPFTHGFPGVRQCDGRSDGNESNKILNRKMKWTA